MLDLVLSSSESLGYLEEGSSEGGASRARLVPRDSEGSASDIASEMYRGLNSKIRLPNVSRSTNTEFSKTVGPLSLSESRSSSSSETSVMVNEVRLVRSLATGASLM